MPKPKKPKPPKPSSPPNVFQAWPHEPEYHATALIRKGGLWAVLGLQLKKFEVIAYDVSTETSFEFAMDKAIRKLSQSVRRS